MPVLEHERVSDWRAGKGADGRYTDSCSDRRWCDPALYDAYKLPSVLPVDRPHSNTSPVKLHHISRDWQNHHQGNNYGFVLGGVLGFVILVLAGGYAFIRWRRARIRKPSMTSHSELENTPIKGSPSVDSAPLLITTEHWTPTLNRIPEQTEEPSALSTLRKESTLRSPQHSRVPPLTKEGTESDMYPLQRRTSTWDPSLPGPSSIHKEVTANDRDQYEEEYRPYQDEAPFPPYQVQVLSVDDLGTPNMTASDSDSMQVNIPWRHSGRFTTSKTQSSPLEAESPQQEPPSPLTPRNPRQSYTQPLPSSPLHLRAVAEEEREHSQASSSRPPAASSGQRRSSVEDSASMNESEGSETASTLSSYAKLKLRLTGSVPFLPLIQESSPLDTDKLWGRVQGDSSRLSLKSQPSPISGKRSSSKPPRSSSSHHLPSPIPHSPSHSAPSRSSHLSITLPPRPASPQPISPKSASSRSPSPTPSSPKPASPPLASSPPSPTSRDRPVSPSPPSMTSPDSTPDLPSVMKLTPEMAAVSSPISHPSPWQTHSSPLTLSGTYDSRTSASSLVLRDLSDFPEPPSSRPRPLPKRPLPHIPPPPSYLPPMPPVRIPGQSDTEATLPPALSPQTSPLNDGRVESNVPVVPQSRSSTMNDSPVPSSDLSHGVKVLPSPGPSKLSLVIQ